MSAMSNPRKPTGLKVVQGTFRKDRAPRNEPKPARISRPRPPAHLSAMGKKAWHKFAAILGPAGLLTALDLFALEGLAESYADLIRARSRLPADGAVSYVVRNRAGGVMARVRPEIAVVDAADKRFAMWLAKFGLDPASRSRVEARPGAGASNPFSELDALQVRR